MDIVGQTFLVTGGAGFIGSHLVDALLGAGAAQVRVFDTMSRLGPSRRARALDDPRVTVIHDGANILYRDVLERSMEGVDGVFHLAACWLPVCESFARTGFDVNVCGTFNVAMAAIRSGVRRLVFSSSIAVYGDRHGERIREDDPLDSKTLYGATKIAGEEMIRSLGQQYGLEWSALRYMNVYGERQASSGPHVAVMHQVLNRIERCEPPMVFGDGSQTFDFVHVSDAARANVLAMQSPRNGGSYNVASGLGTSIRDLTQLLLRLSGSDLEICYQPGRGGDSDRRVGCPEKARRDLGFVCSIALQEGLAALIEWRRAISQRPPDRPTSRG